MVIGWQSFCNEMAPIVDGFRAPSIRTVYLIKKTVVDLLSDRYLLHHRGSDD